MSRIAIITDTDSSLPAELAAGYAIQQVPITIHFGEQSFIDGVEIDNSSLFDRIDRLGKLPTTSAPSPGAFVSAYQKVIEEGADSIVCICVSSGVSATYSAALTASSDFPHFKISVLDSQTLSMGQGFMVLAAAEAAQNGATHDEVVACARSVGERVHLFASLSTLKYLAMSGRVGKVAAGMANLLNIRPILTVRDGKLEMLEKVRTRRAALDRLIGLIGQSVNGRGIERAAIIHVNDTLDADELEIKLAERLSMPQHIHRAEFTPGLSVHAGSGVVGVAFVTSNHDRIDH
jgi:DegV family protein with EDD domain